MKIAYSTSFSFLSEAMSCSFFGTYSCLLILPNSVFISMFRQVFMSPSLGTVSLFGRHHVGSSCMLYVGSSCMLYSSLQRYMLQWCLCGLRVPLCCGGADHSECASRQSWFLARLTVRPCLMQWPWSHWRAGWASCMVGCMVQGVLGLGLAHWKAELGLQN